MSEFLGEAYNYDIWKRNPKQGECFRSVRHAGEPATDFSLPTSDGKEVKLSALRGKPVVIEFGSIT